MAKVTFFGGGMGGEVQTTGNHLLGGGDPSPPLVRRGSKTRQNQLQLEINCYNQYGEGFCLINHAQFLLNLIRFLVIVL